MALTPCLGLPDEPCGIPAPRGGCPRHKRARERAHHNRVYDSTAWHRFRDRTLAVHRARYGNWCPGTADHPPHAIALGDTLTLDHIQRLADGGALLDRANVRVLCRLENSRIGARR